MNLQKSLQKTKLVDTIFKNLDGVNLFKFRLAKVITQLPTPALFNLKPFL